MQPFFAGETPNYKKFATPVPGDTIKWSSEYKLKPEDFLGPAPDSAYYVKLRKKYGFEINRVLANASSEISFSFKIVNRRSTVVEAFAVFTKSKSWIGEKIQMVLDHEQGHFDLTEVYARKFARRMKEYQDIEWPGYYDIFNRELKAIYEELEKEHM